MRSFKFLLAFLLASTFGQAFGQTVLFDYDGTNMDFSSWGTATWSKVANPDATGINTSANVGEFGYSEGWIGVHGDVALPAGIDFAANPYFKMKVYAASAIKVTLKFENFIDYGINAEQSIDLTADQTNKWVEIIFNFNGTVLTNLDRVTLFFDGPKTFSTVGTKYYFDDLISSNVAPTAQIGYLPVANAADVQLFSPCAVSSNFAFVNSDTTAITDPTASVYLKTGSATGTDVPFTASISADKKTININPTALLSTGTTYYYGILENTLKFKGIETFVTNAASSFTTRTTTPTMITYANFDGIDNTTIVEPLGDPAGTLQSNVFDPTNNANTVIQWDKGTTWWGWERIHIELKEAINVIGERIFSLKVYSSKAGYVRLKVSNQKDDGGLAKEVDAQITAANQWQTLYFNLPACETADYKHLLIYIDGGIATAATFYVDDIKGPDFAPANSLLDSPKAGTLAASPNPTTDILKISDVTEGDIVKVVNTLGEVVANLPVNNEQISLASLQNGIYIISVNGYTTKVVKK